MLFPLMRQLVSRPTCATCRKAAGGAGERSGGRGITHQVLGAVQLVRGGGAARDERLEHAAHHHRLHVLGHRLVVASGEVVAEARLVWGGGVDREGRREGGRG